MDLQHHFNEHGTLWGKNEVGEDVVIHQGPAHYYKDRESGAAAVIPMSDALIRDSAVDHEAIARSMAEEKIRDLLSGG